MKKLLVLVTLLLGASISPLALRAQVSSSDCLAEVQKVYAHLDHEALLQGGDQMRFRFKHSYIMRLDEEGKTLTYDETLILGPKLVYYDTPEFTECSDGSEAFHFRKYQYLIYRTKSTLAKTAPIIPGMDKGIFPYCMVKSCEFVTAPGTDTTLHLKRAYLTVNDEGQRKYPIKDLEIVWNPWTHAPLIAGVTFTDKSLYKWARWDFQGISKVETPLAVDAKGNLLDGNGQVLEVFKGSEVVDYR